jgi:hypothetical protein
MKKYLYMYLYILLVIAFEYVTTVYICSLNFSYNMGLIVLFVSIGILAPVYIWLFCKLFKITIF